MEISQYIRDLLFTHDRVILSDFGAFIAKYKAAEIDEETNTMRPPGKQIVFDPAITKDGGLLRDYMVEQEGISAQDAEKQIIEYVKTIKSKLNAGKQVKFTELGTFVKLKDNKILFNYTPSENLLTESFGLAGVPIPEESSQKFIMPETQSDPVHKENKSKKRYKGTLIFILIMALIVLAGVAIYFLRPAWIDYGRTYVTELFEKNTDVADTDTDGEDSNAATDTTDGTDSSVTDDTGETDGTDDTVIPESTDTGGTTTITPQDGSGGQDAYAGDVAMKSPKRGHSYLIVASLPTPQDAEKERKRLKAKGIETDIIPAGQGKFRLSVGEFTGFQEATRFYNDFYTKHKMDTWLWEY